MARKYGKEGMIAARKAAIKRSRESGGIFSGKKKVTPPSQAKAATGGKATTLGTKYGGSMPNNVATSEGTKIAARISKAKTPKTSGSRGAARSNVRVAPARPAESAGATPASSAPRTVIKTVTRTRPSDPTGPAVIGAMGGAAAAGLTLKARDAYKNRAAKAGKPVEAKTGRIRRAAGRIKAAMKPEYRGAETERIGRVKPQNKAASAPQDAGASNRVKAFVERHESKAGKTPKVKVKTGPSGPPGVGPSGYNVKPRLKQPKPAPERPRIEPKAPPETPKLKVTSPPKVSGTTSQQEGSSKAAGGSGKKPTVKAVTPQPSAQTQSTGTTKAGEVIVKKPGHWVIKAKPSDASKENAAPNRVNKPQEVSSVPKPKVVTPPRPQAEPKPVAPPKPSVQSDVNKPARAKESPSHAGNDPSVAKPKVKASGDTAALKKELEQLQKKNVRLKVKSGGVGKPTAEAPAPKPRTVKLRKGGKQAAPAAKTSKAPLPVRAKPAPTERSLSPEQIAQERAGAKAEQESAGSRGRPGKPKEITISKKAPGIPKPSAKPSPSHRAELEAKLAAEGKGSGKVEPTGPQRQMTKGAPVGETYAGRKGAQTAAERQAQIEKHMAEKGYTKIEGQGEEAQVKKIGPRGRAAKMKAQASKAAAKKAAGKRTLVKAPKAKVRAKAVKAISEAEARAAVAGSKPKVKAKTFTSRALGALGTALMYKDFQRQMRAAKKLREMRKKGIITVRREA